MSTVCMRRHCAILIRRCSLILFRIPTSADNRPGQERSFGLRGTHPACVAQNGGLHVHLQRCAVGRHQSQPTRARYRAQVPNGVPVGHTKVCRGLGSHGAACDDGQGSDDLDRAAFLAHRDARNLAAQRRFAILRRTSPGNTWTTKAVESRTAIVQGRDRWPLADIFGTWSCTCASSSDSSIVPLRLRSPFLKAPSSDQVPRITATSRRESIGSTAQ